MVSCQLYNESEIYRGERASKHYKKRYKPIDSIKINKIRICKKQNNDINEKLRTDGKLNIRLENIEQDIIGRLKNNFNYVDYKLHNDTMSNFNCAYLTRKNVLSGNYKIETRTSNRYNLELTFELFYTSTRDPIIDGFFGRRIGVWDNDRHFIHHVLRIAIFYKNELIYMDNYIYQKEIFSGIDKNVHHEVPQQIIDSLVAGSLSEYYERLE